MRDECLQIGAAVAVVVGPLDVDVCFAVVNAVAVFVDLHHVADLIAARIRGKHVAVFVEPADALAVPPTLENIGLAVVIYVETNYLV